MQHVEAMGHNVIWWEIPGRRDCGSARTRSGETQYQEHLLPFIANEFARIRDALSIIAGEPITDQMILDSISKQNRIRALVGEIRDLVYLSPVCPLPALEMLLIEFLPLDCGGDPDECIEMLEHMKAMVTGRVERGEGVLPADAAKVVWIGPPADMLLLNLFEDLGGRVVGSEYMIDQTRHLIDPSPYTLHPTPYALSALADCFLNASLIGGAQYRAEKVMDEARRSGAQGIVYSGVFGGSHCLAEDRLIAQMARDGLGLPTLDFDTPFPMDTPHAQLRTKMETFLESIQRPR